MNHNPITWRLTMLARVAAVVVMFGPLHAPGASYRTPNFVIETESAQLAEEFGKTAETLRHDLAVSWLGQPIDQWSQPCPITVRVGPYANTNSTTFVFNDGEVFGWHSTCQGPQERIIDSVLPHEINHMVLASHFRRAVPRWADEGMATSVEHPSEWVNWYSWLDTALRTGRGLAFNRMFAMTEVDNTNFMPIYAQGLTLTEFLIQQGGRHKFVKYIGDGLDGNQWATATKTHYGYQDLGELQNAWVAWVGKGRPPAQTVGYG